MVYQPPRALGVSVGLGLTLWSAATAYVLLDAGVTSGIGLRSLLAYAAGIGLGALAVLFAYWTYSLATLAYAIDRNGLVITYGPLRQVVPLGAIERLVAGTAVGVPSVRGVSWWGHHVGRAEIDRIGETLFYSTHQSPEQVLFVMTPAHTYAISVDDPAAFAREIQRRQELGQTAEVRHHVERSGPAAHALARDRLGLGLALVAVAADLAVWVQVVLRYPSLPPSLQLHFPPGGTLELVTLTSRDVIFQIPRSATAILAVNLGLGAILHGWERAAGYVLFGAAAALQVALFVAAAIALA